MDRLSSFLSENAHRGENEKFMLSGRFVFEGEPVCFEIKSVSGREDEKLRKGSLKKDGCLDFELYMGKLAAMCTVVPNLNDAELQQSYNVLGADNLLKEMLLPGEYSLYIKKIQKVNGFNITMDELVDEAKN